MTRPSQGDDRFRQALPHILTWLLIVIYAGLFSWLSITRHRAFMTNAFDLGNVDQAMWNTAHGRPLAFTNWRGVDLDLATDNRMAMHVEPIYLLIAPLYWVWSSPEALLVLQSVALALGAWPVFRLARRRLGSPWAGEAFAAAYLLMPGLEAANLWEWHAVTLAAPLMLYAFDYAQERRYSLFWLFAILAMATKEEIPLAVLMMALYVAWTDRPGRRWALALALVAASWFVLAVGVVIPHFEGDRSPYLRYYGDIGDGPLGLVRTAIRRPDVVISALLTPRNLGYLRDLFFQLGFLSLLHPATLSIAAPDLAINLLSDHEPMHFVEKYHYVAPMVPGLIIAAIFGTGWLAERVAGRWPQRRREAIAALTVWLLAAALFYHYYHGYTPLARAFEPYRVTDHHRLGEEIARQIPADAAVSAQPNLNPHVSQRRVLYRFPYVGDAEYVFVDVSSLANKRNMFADIEAMIERGEFGIVRAEDGYLLLRRGAPKTELPDRFFDFARVRDPQPDYRVDVTFAPAGEEPLLRLIGFDLWSGRHTEMPQTPLRFFFYFQALRPVDEDYAIALYLLNEDGEVIGGMDLEEKPGVQYWYPTSRWQPGETIKLEISDMPWWTAQYPSYRVALGIVRGTDPWDVGARLLPTIRDSDLVLPLASERTLVDLMAFKTDLGGMPQRIERWRRFTPPKMAYRQEATWGNQVTLLGYDVEPRRIQPGGTIEVTLYWQRGDAPSPDFTVFVHVVGPDGLRGQHDSQPGLGSLPISTWAPGEVVADRHPVAVDANAPQGDYWIAVGWYDPQTGARVPLLDGADHLRLSATLQIR